MAMMSVSDKHNDGRKQIATEGRIAGEKDMDVVVFHAVSILDVKRKTYVQGNLGCCQRQALAHKSCEIMP